MIDKKIGKILILVLLIVTMLEMPSTSKASRIDENVSSTVWNEEKLCTVTIGDWKFSYYVSSDEEYCWIKYAKLANQKKVSTLEFPEDINGLEVIGIGPYEDFDIDGEFCANVLGVTVEPYHDYIGTEDMVPGIKNVIIPETVRNISLYTFVGFTDLQSIKIPDQVKQIDNSTFYGCKNLKKVEFPASLEKMSMDAFEQCDALDTISIGENSLNYTCYKGMLLTKDKKQVVWVQPKLDSLVIPSSVKTIGVYATEYSNVKKVSIPASVTKIENESLSGNKITNITISSKNTHYGKSGSCIYSKVSKRLVAAICNNGTVILPNEVKCIKNDFSIAGKHVKKLYLPKSLKELQEEWYDNDKISYCKIYFKSLNPPKVSGFCLPNDTTYYVPKKSLSKYKKWYKDSQKLNEEYNEEFDYYKIIGY